MRLIDGDALYEKARGFQVRIIIEPYTKRRVERGFEIDDVLSAIDQAPIIDAVPVVRCKDCKHFSPYEGEEYKGDCMELVGLESCVYEDDFCSYGEREDNHETD